MRWPERETERDPEEAGEAGPDTHLIALLDGAEKGTLLKEGLALTAGLLEASRESVGVQLGNEVILLSCLSLLSVTNSCMAS